jgi:hypothetical protein
MLHFEDEDGHLLVTDVSEVLTASIIRAMIALMVEEVIKCKTSKCWLLSVRLHGTTSQKTLIVMCYDVRT